MKKELTIRPCLKPVFEIISNTDANFVNLHIDKATKTRSNYLVALTTQLSSFLLVLGGLNLHSAICFAKQRVRSELTNKLGNNVTSVDEYSKIVTAQQLGDRIMHIMHISRLKYNSGIEKPYSNDNLN